MSLYRQAGGRPTWALLLAAAVVATLAGVGGYVIGSSGQDEEPDLERALESVREDLHPAISGLELVTIEYPEAIRDGRVVAPTEYEAAREHLARAEDAFAGAATEIEPLAAERVARARADLDRLSALIEKPAPAAEVEAAADRAASSVRALTGSTAPAE